MDTFKRRSVQRIDRCVAKLFGNKTKNYRFIGDVVTSFIIPHPFVAGDVLMDLRVFENNCSNWAWLSGRTMHEFHSINSHLPDIYLIKRVTPKTAVYVNLRTESIQRSIIEDHPFQYVTPDPFHRLAKCTFEEAVSAVNDTRLSQRWVRYTDSIIADMTHQYSIEMKHLRKHNFLSL